MLVIYRFVCVAEKGGPERERVSGGADDDVYDDPRNESWRVGFLTSFVQKVSNRVVV